MWNKITDKERAYFKHFIFMQNIRDSLAVMSLIIIIPVTINYVYLISSKYGVTELFELTPRIISTFLVMLEIWFINVCSSTSHGLHVRLLLLFKNSKYCYATMYGKTIYTGVKNRTFYNLQKYTFISDIDAKIFKRKKVFFVDSKCDKDSSRLLIFKARRGFLYYGICI